MSIVLFIIAAIFAVYGMTIMLTWSGTWFFAVWYVLGALAFALGMLLHTGAWEHIPLLARRIAGGIGALALVALVVTQALVIGSFNATSDDDADYVIVLGAQVHPTGPSVVLQYRLDTAYDYLIAHPEAKCIVSGGKGTNEVAPEAEIMASYLENRGIGSERILKEDRSRTTVENIRFSSEYLDPTEDRILIVSNNFHMFRALSIARKQGLEHASGLAAPSRAWYLPNNMFRETFGIIKDSVCGNM